MEKEEEKVINFWEVFFPRGRTEEVVVGEWGVVVCEWLDLKGGEKSGSCAADKAVSMMGNIWALLPNAFWAFYAFCKKNFKFLSKIFR